MCYKKKISNFRENYKISAKIVIKKIMPFVVHIYKNSGIKCPGDEMSVDEMSGMKVLGVEMSDYHNI